MTPVPRLCVVVPTRDRPERLARCLAALERQTADRFEIVVVDDASRDPGAVRAAVAGALRARLVRGEDAARRRRAISGSVRRARR